MPSDPADLPAAVGRRHRRLIGLALLLGAVVAAVVAVGLGRGPERAVVPGGAGARSRAAPAADDARSAAASRLLDRLAEVVEHGTPHQLAALAAPGDRAAARQLGDLRANARSLRIQDLTFRYVDQAAPVAGQPTLGPRDWVADVQLGWRLAGADAHGGAMEVPLVLREEGARARFVTSRYDTGHPTPLWLLERVRVVRTAQSLVVTARTQQPARFSRLADRAVHDVRRVLGRWRGRLVVEVPAGQPELVRVLGRQAGDYAEIAAVTTTADRSASRSAPVHIFVNPRVFDPLGPRGSQIVMSHEATHVATGAALSRMPTWLLEGFADYVALDHADLPVSVTASQILGQVRRDDTPRHLPGAAEFDGRNPRLGASYESAWLACRLLGESYGESRLIAFYRASDRASSTTGPFRTVLGTDQADFTRAWRADLRRLAGLAPTTARHAER